MQFTNVNTVPIKTDDIKNNTNEGQRFSDWYCQEIKIYPILSLWYEIEPVFSDYASNSVPKTHTKVGPKVNE